MGIETLQVLNTQSNGDDDVFDNLRLPPAPDTPIDGKGIC